MKARAPNQQETKLLEGRDHGVLIFVSQTHGIWQALNTDLLN